MSTGVIASLVFVCLVGAVLAGRWLNAVLSERHWATGTQETVKLSLGLVATMAAVLLGLLVNAAKSSYDEQKHQVIEMGARISVLDRLLGIYGDEAASARADLRVMVRSAVARAWPGARAATSGWTGEAARFSCRRSNGSRRRARCRPRSAVICGAIVLLLELYHPFDGPLRISSAPVTQALGLPGN